MVPYNQLKPHQLPPSVKVRNADGTESTHYSIFYDGIPNEFKHIPYTELNETDEKRKKYMQSLREFLKEEEITGVEDHLLLCCLRKCKYNYNKAEKQLVKYLKTRDHIIERLRKADMKKLEEVLDHMVVGVLPYRDKKGRAIFCTTPNIDLKLFDVEDACLVYYVTLGYILTSPLTSTTGIVYIAEAKTPALDLMYQIMKAFRRDLGLITAFPGRIAKIEILNEMFIVRWTVNLIKPILTAKSVERINFYGSEVTNLRKTYPPELLPDEFGGTMGPLCNTFCKEEIMNYIKKMMNQNILNELVIDIINQHLVDAFQKNATFVTHFKSLILSLSPIVRKEKDFKCINKENP